MAKSRAFDLHEDRMIPEIGGTFQSRAKTEYHWLESEMRCVHLKLSVLGSLLVCAPDTVVLEYLLSGMSSSTTVFKVHDLTCIRKPFYVNLNYSLYSDALDMPFSALTTSCLHFQLEENLSAFLPCN